VISTGDVPPAGNPATSPQHSAHAGVRRSGEANLERAGKPPFFAVVKNDRLLGGADILESIQTLMKGATTMKKHRFPGLLVELGGLEPPASWVRYRRIPAPVFAWLRYV
jgi:hypothetical protein